MIPFFLVFGFVALVLFFFLPGRGEQRQFERQWEESLKHQDHARWRQQDAWQRKIHAENEARIETIKKIARLRSKSK